LLSESQTILLQAIIEQARSRCGDTPARVLLAKGHEKLRIHAAEVLAKELDRELYRVDLQAIAGKYIGETEKNLEALFDTARETDAILFFDEADALFGKRSEVKDAHDRYANLEVNYLLQLIENYSGIAILATNHKHHIDEAFLRHFRFVVDL
jgi:SpoVK/Ycf46/Vps4 family AAA+-type ATPase